MAVRGCFRGHDVWFDESADLWRYTDTGEPVPWTWEKRPCGHCGEHTTKDGHDPCIANLPGVMNACCGHGKQDESYVQFWNGMILRGFRVCDLRLLEPTNTDH